MENLIDIKKSISSDDMFSLLTELGAEPKDAENAIECLTICHGGDSHKLIYYKNSNNFVCYTNDGTFDIFKLVSLVKNISFNESIDWIKTRFNLGKPIIGQFKHNIENHKSLVDNPLKNINIIKKENNILKPLNENILNVFYEYYYSGWLKEGITKKVLNQFEIKYSIIDNQIIIPHRDYEGNLIGVRARNLNKYLIDEGKKYIPIFYNGKSYKYQTGLNLYGIYQNKNIINKTHQVILFEAEKSVMKMNSFYGISNSLALNGTMLSNYQVDLLNNLDINEVIIAVDKEFDDYTSDEAKIYASKIESIFKKLMNKYTVSIIWDKNNLLKRKDSPVDEGKSIFEKLIKDRIFLNNEE